MTSKGRCESPDSSCFSKIRSSELLKGAPQLRQRQELSLPTVKHVKTPQEWLERSNRLLEIVNKTSQIVQEMKKGGRQRGFYNIASSSCENPHRNSSLERIVRCNPNPLSSQSANTLKHAALPAKFDNNSEAKKANPLKGMLLKKLQNIRTKILIEADQIKLQKRIDVDDKERVLMEKPCRRTRHNEHHPHAQQPRTVAFDRPKLERHEFVTLQNRTSQLVRRPKLEESSRAKDKNQSMKIELLEWPKGRNISRLSPWHQDTPIVVKTEQSQYD